MSGKVTLHLKLIDQHGCAAGKKQKDESCTFELLYPKTISPLLPPNLYLQATALFLETVVNFKVYGRSPSVLSVT